MLDITISFSVGAILIHEEWDVRFNMSSVCLFTDYLFLCFCFLFGKLPHVCCLFYFWGFGLFFLSIF